MPTRPGDSRWMALACELTHLCPRAETAYAVGAVIVAANGTELARGYSRETDPKVHAEEAALAKLGGDDPRLGGATMYSTLEPCSQRGSRPQSCAQRIRDSGISRVVIAWREPSLFVAEGRGVEALVAAGVVVEEMPEFAEKARAANTHLGV